MRWWQGVDDGLALLCLSVCIRFQRRQQSEQIGSRLKRLSMPVGLARPRKMDRKSLELKSRLGLEA